MAYMSHVAYAHRRGSYSTSRFMLSPKLLIAAVVAIMGIVFGLNLAIGSNEQSTLATKKGDKLVSLMATSPVDRAAEVVNVRNDAAARTTTVERSHSSDLSARETVSGRSDAAEQR